MPHAHYESDRVEWSQSRRPKRPTVKGTEVFHAGIVVGADAVTHRNASWCKLERRCWNERRDRSAANRNEMLTLSGCVKAVGRTEVVGKPTNSARSVPGEGEQDGSSHHSLRLSTDSPSDVGDVWKFSSARKTAEQRKTQPQRRRRKQRRRSRRRHGRCLFRTFRKHRAS